MYSILLGFLKLGNKKLGLLGLVGHGAVNQLCNKLWAWTKIRPQAFCEY